MANIEFKNWRKTLLQASRIEPLRLGMTQEDLRAVFGEPDDMSSDSIKGRPLIFKYDDIEFHFDDRYGHKLFLIFSENEDNGVKLNIMRGRAAKNT
jgi:hypothetical protein